ncbi:MAG: hypothetical protein ACXVGG_12765 [Mycobacteriaceae bacterium]
MKRRLLVLMATGALVAFIGTGTAHADMLQQNAGIVCRNLGLPSPVGLPARLAHMRDALLQQGFTPQQMDQIFAYAANVACPQYHDVIVQTVSSW